MDVGRLGLFSMLKGATGYGHAIHVHKAHVGSDEQSAHAYLARAGAHGAHGAIAMITCKDAETRGTVTSRAADRGIES